jgi:hypothetical protein
LKKTPTKIEGRKEPVKIVRIENEKTLSPVESKKEAPSQGSKDLSKKASAVITVNKNFPVANQK